MPNDAPVATVAQPQDVVPPHGGEILVNTATEGDQTAPEITRLSNGGFVITWTDQSQGVGGATGDNESHAVKAQIVSADGGRVGGEILANTATVSDQSGQKIAALSNGGFVITWTDHSQGVGGATGDNEGYAVKAQVFTADGARVGPEILVNTHVAGDQAFSQIIALSQGGFAVSWEDSTGDGDYAVKARVFGADGVPVSSEILVNSAVAGEQNFARMTALSNGGFAVTWEDMSLGMGGATGDNSGHAIKAQVFSADGAPVGSEILVNTNFAGEQRFPRIEALSGGGFAIAWMDRTGDGDGSAAKLRVFGAGGAPVSNEILLNTVYKLGDQVPGEITALPGGRFVAVWADSKQGPAGGAEGDFTKGGVKAQLFEADGTKVGAEIVVDTFYSAVLRIAALSNGGFEAVWERDNQGGSSAVWDIKAQQFDANGTPVGGRVSVNTATAGAQTGPLIVALNGGFAVTWRDFSHGVGGATGDTSGAALKAQVYLGAINTPPVEAINTGLSVSPGQVTALSSSNLLYGDAEQPDSQILFTVTSASAGGILYKNGAALGVNGSFTQDDIDAGAIAWQSDGTSPTGSFGFQVSDGAGGLVSGKSFTVHESANTAPVEVNNINLTVQQGQVTALTWHNLLYGDAEQPDSEILFTLTSAAAGGTLYKSGVPLGLNGSFTQDDIDADAITWLSDGSATGSFGFQVTDGAGGLVSGKSFTFHTNTSPVEAINSPLLDPGGGTVTISSDYLLYGDDEQPDSQIVYTITQAVTAGTVLKNGVALGVGGSFNQDDLDAGAITYQGNGSQSGVASFGFQVTDGAGGLVGGRTFAIHFAPTGSHLVGDLDHDGYQELMTSAVAGNVRNHEAYFLWGSANGYASVASYPSMTADKGFIVVNSKDVTPKAAPIGDVNGDGYDDLGFTTTAIYDVRGYVAVIFGGPRPLGSINQYNQDVTNLANLPTSQGFILRGASDIDRMSSVWAIGDINGDGIGDFAAGAFNRSFLYPQSGAIYVMYGTTGAFGPPSGGTTTINAADITPAMGFAISGGAYYNLSTAAAAGDVNHDGYNDFTVSGAGSGGSFVIFGGPDSPGELINGQKVLDLVHLSPDDGNRVGSSGSAPNFKNAAAAFAADGTGEAQMETGAAGLEHLSSSHPIVNHEMMVV